ncbi:uncharacterized protein [Branchiostoma lanceolatum]|uniref:uncharacterized protein n=1 Tax=Branchiostoma lanceolatum TaxID=7740 RepID=UPI003454C35E
MGGTRGRKKKAGKTQNGKKSDQKDVSGLSKAEKRQRLEERREQKKTQAATQKTKSKFTVDELLDKVEECMDSYNYEVAQKFCQRALELEPDNLRALEVSGSLLLELGDGDKAKQCFGRAVELSPEDGFTKYMCLGQLLEGEEAVACYNKGIQVMMVERQKQQQQLEGAAACDPDSQKVTSQDISSAYCSIAEIYLTDSCFEDSAEEKCKESLEKAIEECPTNPEAHLLMASYQLSKDNRDEAKQAIEKSLSLWLPERSDAEEEEEEEMEENMPEDPPLPYEQRIATAKILIELEVMESAEKVLAGLLLEDDEIVQVWYLLGWLHYVQGEDHKAAARDNLQHALKIYPIVGCDDEDMLEHMKELLEDLGPGEAEEEDEEQMDEEQEELTFDDEEEEDEDRSTQDAMDH